MALMTFEVPAGYSRIPVGLTLAETREFVAGPAAAMEVAGDEAENQTLQLHQWSTALRALGAMYAGAYWRGEGDQSRFGMLLVAAQPLAYGDAHLASRGLPHGLRDPEDDATAAKPFDLPCGPASVFARQIDLPVEGERSAAEGGAVVPVGELQAYIPVPRELSGGREEIVVVAFQTPDLDHWDTYAQHLVFLLKSIKFDEEPRSD
ncbi:hypothetical protein O7599_15115 [Streptomyces sp. WMMC500]|uniref:hypothetical protein n=1 Tax=Streptomyces sp. WMMC500 TaxID=3015154 RepID=UPI00248AF8BC|nr:hypothetical protein [Streptomyces sp. WMMC500]WBB63766.1 hypothetical protein O7599_15115 [Streptomyces sp. WMMC500]